MKRFQLAVSHFKQELDRFTLFILLTDKCLLCWIQKQLLRLLQLFVEMRRYSADNRYQPISAILLRHQALYSLSKKYIYGVIVRLILNSVKL